MILSSFTHIPTLKPPMSAEIPALLYIEKAKIEQKKRLQHERMRHKKDLSSLAHISRTQTNHFDTKKAVSSSQGSHVNREYCIASHRTTKDPTSTTCFAMRHKVKVKFSILTENTELFAPKKEKRNVSQPNCSLDTAKDQLILLQ